jgi:hypothetical protein
MRTGFPRFSSRRTLSRENQSPRPEHMTVPGNYKSTVLTQPPQNDHQTYLPDMICLLPALGSATLIQRHRVHRRIHVSN